jgi:hypothetical protein
MRYTLERSAAAHKKYVAILSNGRRVHFGDTRYQQYRDSTPLQLYSHLDHGDPKRRASFLSRMGKAVPYSANWFAQKYLW